MRNVYTIGYGNRSMEDFLSLLDRYGITCLVDVRSKPFYSYNRSFSQKVLQSSLPSEISYVWMRELGGLEGVLEEDRMMGVDKVKALLDSGETVCLMCAELDPNRCHRKKLLPHFFKQEGIELVHIDKVGELEAREEPSVPVVEPRLL